jgi:hypothetical protein
MSVCKREGFLLNTSLTLSVTAQNRDVLQIFVLYLVRAPG